MSRRGQYSHQGVGNILRGQGQDDPENTLSRGGIYYSRPGQEHIPSRIPRQGYPVKDNRHGNFVKDIPQKPPIKDPIKDIRSSGSTLPGGGHMTSGEEVIQYQEEGYTLKEGI
jgi:hypothetical protein